MSKSPASNTLIEAVSSVEAVHSWLSVVRAYNLCDSLLTRNLSKVGLRTAEHEILVNLLREPGLSQQALAERCFTVKSHISALLTNMQERGWLRRESDPRDARAKRLILEEAGVRVANKGLLVQTQVVTLMAQACTAEQLHQVREAMLPISAALDRELRL